MKTLYAFLVSLTLIAAPGAVRSAGGDAEPIEPLRSYVRERISEFDRIEPDRREALKQVAAFIRERSARGATADLIFICTHNSRRSHLSQLWAQTAACHYGIANVATWSGGTEVAACNIRTVRALRRAGFSIVRSTDGPNPVYLAQYSDDRPMVKMYSKLFQADENPQSGFAALFCCDSAAADCPVVPNAALRLPILYVDPKASDGSPEENATYDERTRQIAREMLFLMSSVHPTDRARGE